LRIVVRRAVSAQFASLPESDDQRHRQGAGAHAAFMPAAVHLGDEPDPGTLFPHIEGAHSLGAIHLMSRERHQVDAHGLHVDGNFPDPLCGVAVKQDAFLLGDFVVGQHDGNQDSLVRDRVPYIVGVDHAVFIDLQIGDRCQAFGFERLGRIEHGAVFRG
jgi:hypothetical protein